MLRTVKSLQGHRLRAADGELGKVKEFYFDDADWVVRYLVADTGNWLTGRRVLISPRSLGKPTGSDDVLPVSLTRQQIEHCPSISADKPISRQYEVEIHTHYGLAPYWAAHTPPPIELARPPAAGGGGGTATMPATDTHLRSSREVTGYHIEASDDEIGHVDDFIIDTDDWPIRYMVVDTRNWLPGKKVLISPGWIKSVDWVDQVVRVDMTRDQVKGSPPFNPEACVNREYELRLYDYYGRQRYW